MELTLGLAFIAGIVSFLSPCVLPLVPAYVGYMGGRLTNDVAVAHPPGNDRPLRARFNTGVHGLFFVAGFTLVFVTIGLLSTAFIQQVGGSNIALVTEIIGRIGGVLIVFFGLHFMGVLPRLFAWLRATAWLDRVVTSIVLALVAGAVLAWGFTGTVALWASPLWDTAAGIPLVGAALTGGLWVWLLINGAFTRPGAFWNHAIDRLEIALYSDTRQHSSAGRGGYLGSGVMGVVFAAGWTPCIGPVYGAVLTLAASGGDVGEAGTLLAAYSLGLGVPFLLAALMLDSMQGLLRRLQRRMQVIELASGTFLIVIGLSVASGQLQGLSARFADDFADFSIGLEEQVVELVQGEDAAPEPPPSNAAPRDPAPDSRVADLTVGLNVGDIAPDFQTVTASGDPVALSDLRGQTVLLNFWATWCGPCRVEMPEFQAQYEALKDDGFTILAVNNAEPPATVKAFGDEFGLTFPLALDQRAAIQQQYGIFSYPSTLVLDPNGVIVAKHFGPLTTEQIALLLDSVIYS